MLRFRRAHGTPVTFGGVTITPEAQMLMWHGGRAAMVWNRPSAVLVEQDGREQRIPIIDVTRLLQFFLFGTVVAVPIMRLLTRRPEGRSTDVQ